MLYLNMDILQKVVKFIDNAKKKWYTKITVKDRAENRKPRASEKPKRLTEQPERKIEK